MSKPWIAYLSYTLLLLAGIFMIAGGKPLAGAIFIVAALAGTGLQLYMKRNSQNHHD